MKPKTKNKPNKLGIGKKVFFFFLFLSTAGLLFSLAGNGYVKHTGGQKIRTPETIAKAGTFDCIMVLGCGLRADNTPTLMLADRLDRGIELYQAGIAPKLLMSGDHGRIHYDEVNQMKQYAIDRGVPSADIFMDHAGFSTYESMYRAKEIFQVSKMVVVTQQYHLYRAVYNGGRMGIDTYGVASRNTRFGGQRTRDFREFLARNKDLLIGIYRPKPTFLGEAIPVSGDGNVTNDKNR